MNPILLSSGTLNIQVREYVPLIIMCALLAVLFLVFRLTGVKSKLLWNLLINGMIGAGMLCLFDIVFYTYLHMDFFHIKINWLSSIVAGILGVPGVLLMLILKFLI